MLKGKIFWIGLLVLLLAVGAIATGCGGAEEPAAPENQGPEKLKVGLVFDVGGRGDKSFNDAAYAGLERAAQEFSEQIEVKYLEPSASGENREQLLRLLAQDQYDLIFGIGFMFTETIDKVAKDFPEAKFGLVDGFVPDLTPESNISCLLFREHEGSFLVGAAAALKSQTGKVGYVGGMKIPLIEKFEACYIAGAKYINPDIVVLSDYVGTTSDAFKDPVKGKELALKQIKDGADVIYHASGASGIGVIEAAAAQQKFVIGVDSDQSLTATDEQRPYVLTSMLKRVDVSVYNTIKALVEDNFQGGYQEFGVKEDGVGYAVNQYNQDLLADISAELDAIKAKIVAGEIEIPTSPQ